MATDSAVVATPPTMTATARHPGTAPRRGRRRSGCAAVRVLCENKAAETHGEDQRHDDP
jgi:hypothetical protein